jgi:phage shock protein C
MTRRLYRSRGERIIGGVCGGLAAYFEIDPTVIRFVFLLAALLGGHGILVYLALWIIMPPEPLTA